MPSRIQYDEIIHPSTQSQLNKFWESVISGIKKTNSAIQKEAKAIKSSLTKISPDAKGIKTLKQAQTQTEKLSKAQRILKQTEQESLKIKKQLEQAIAKKNAMSQKEYAQLQKVRQSTRQMTREMSLQRGSIESLRVKTNALVKQRDRLNLSTKKGRLEERQLRREIARNEAQLKKYDRQIGRNFRNVGNYASAFRNLGAAMGITLGAYGIFRVLKNAVGIISKFSYAMSKVRAVSGATAEQMKLLEKDAERLGRTTQKTATEVANLQYEFSKLGFSTQEILAATEATLALSIAAGSDLAESAEVAGATIRGFGLDAKETQRVVDIMAKSFSTSALNLERFRESMKYVAPIARAAGISIEQTTGMLAKLADAGIHGSQAGTSMRRILSEIDKTGKSTSLALADLAEKGLDLASAEDEVGRRAKTALLILVDQKDAIKDLTKEYENATGAADEMRRIMEDNLIGDVFRLKSAWEGFILALKNSEGTLRVTVQRLNMILTGLRLLVSPREEALLEVTFEKAKKNIDIWDASMKRLGLSTDEYNKRIDEHLKYLDKELKAYEDIDWKNAQMSQRALNRITKEIAYLKNLILLTQQLRKESAAPKAYEGKTPVESTPFPSLLPRVNLEKLEMITAKVVRRVKDYTGKATQEAQPLEKPSFIERLLGLGEPQKQDIKEALQQYVYELQNILMGLTAAMIDFAQGQVSASEQILDNLYNQLDEEKKAREDGKASNIQLLETQIAEEKKIRDRAQKDLEKAQKAQQAVNTAMELSSLTVASANIIKAFSALGIPGLVLGIAAVTSLVSWYTAMKVKMAALTRKGYAEGTEYLERGKHPKGRDTIPIWADEGERIISKEDNKKLGKLTNKQLVDELYMWNFYKGHLPDMAQKNLSHEIIEELKGQKQVQRDTLEYMKQKADAIDLGNGQYLIIKGYKKELVTVVKK